jgi:hypothetical protein
VINAKVRTLCFLFTFCFLGVVNVNAQVGQVEQGLSSGGAFKLSNGNETTTVCFYLKNGDDGVWRRSCLDPNHYRKIPNATTIKVVSENRKVQYRVRVGKRYRIVWRDAEKYWDVELVN